MTQLRRPIFWHLLRRADVPWHATEAVREHLRHADAAAGIRPHWDNRVGPIWCEFSEENWLARDDDNIGMVHMIIYRRGAGKLADNDDGPPSGSVN